jgi:hypothetical protein
MGGNIISSLFKNHSNVIVDFGDKNIIGSAAGISRKIINP